jgi:hypothetical protein
MTTRKQSKLQALRVGLSRITIPKLWHLHMLFVKSIHPAARDLLTSSDGCAHTGA